MRTRETTTDQKKPPWWEGILLKKGTTRFHVTASIATSAILVAAALGMLIWSLDLGFGVLRQPGPGMWPTIVAAMMLLFVFFIIFVERISTIEDLTRHSWRVAAGVASLIVFVVAFSWLGLIIPVFLLMLLWTWWLGRESFLTSVAVSAVFTALLYSLFRVGLKVPFPQDAFIQFFSSI